MVRRVTLTRIIQLQHNKFIFLKVRTESLMLTWQLQVFIKKNLPHRCVCVCIEREMNQNHRMKALKRMDRLVTVLPHL